MSRVGEHFAVAADPLAQRQGRAADLTTRVSTVSASSSRAGARYSTVQRRTANTYPRLRRDAAMVETEAAQHLGAAALGEFEVVGVVDHAGRVGVLVIDAQVEAVAGKSWIAALRPSRRPLRGLLRMSKALGCRQKKPHPEEARSAVSKDAGRLCSNSWYVFRDDGRKRRQQLELARHAGRHRQVEVAERGLGQHPAARVRMDEALLHQIGAPGDARASVWSRGLRLGVATLGVAGQPIVWDRLPRSGVGHELADARPDPGIAVERPHANADRIGVVRVASE